MNHNILFSILISQFNIAFISILVDISNNICKIGKLNVKITTSNKELEKLELEYKKKRLELKKYKNERVGLQLKLQELELESNKKVTNNNEIRRMQRRTIEKYCNDPNNEYYTQEKTYANLEDSYMSYMKKNIVLYND